ncbi:Uncharacterised protein [uncultured archaeon]|nr:Uncharacterised protein [uncultured archaeon]
MRQERGLLLIAMGFLLVMVSILQDSRQGNSGYGGVILIGPIPIVFGSTPEMAITSMFVATGLMVLAFLLFRRR